MTPNDIEVLLHYHVSGTLHPRHMAPAVRDAVNLFVRSDILKPANTPKGALLETDNCGHSGYDVTERGKALVHLLCKTKFPVAIWADEHGKPIFES